MDYVHVYLYVLSVASLLITLLITEVVCSIPKGDHMNVTAELLRNYDHIYSRPVPLFNQTIKLEFFMYVNQIIELNERDQHITISSLIEMEWQDVYLCWNTTQYPGVTQLNIPVSKIWQPDVRLYESVQISWSTDGLAWLFSNGTVIWATAAVSTTSCQIDSRFFPFDTQRCFVRFASWVHTISQMNIIVRTSRTKSDSRQYFIENGIWDLVTVEVKRHVVEWTGYGGYPELLYTLVLSRRPLFHVMTMILPCAMLSLLNLLVFILPTESGEKVSLGITNVLALVVFLQLIGESLPPTSDKMPIIILYYFTPMIVTGCLSVTSGVVVAYLHNRQTNQPKLTQQCLNVDVDECHDDDINDTKDNFINPALDKLTVKNGTQFQCESCKTKKVSPFGGYSYKQFSSRDLATLVNRVLFIVCILITLASMSFTTIKIMAHDGGS